MTWKDEIEKIPSVLEWESEDDPNYEELAPGCKPLEIDSDSDKSLIDVLKENGLEDSIVVGVLENKSDKTCILVKQKVDVQTKPAMDPPAKSIYPMEPLRNEK